MKIYKAEHSIAEKVLSNTSVAYLSPAQPLKEELQASSNEALEKALSNFKATAKFKDGLYFTKSVLVSTIWNLNDDVFLKEPCWAARNTPINKPSNLNHNESRPVGHMIDTWCVDADGSLIPDDTSISEVPDKFHICDASVIWTIYESEELITQAKELIEEIESGTKYVSMEAAFANFDYSISRAGTDTFDIVERNEDTSFLTQHLRAYGGAGDYNDCKVGRVLRDFVFSGKGYVDSPGNPESIIINEGHKFDFSKSYLRENPFDETSGVYVTCGSLDSRNQQSIKEDNDSMAEVNELLQARLDKAEASLVEKNTALEDLKNQFNESAVAAVKEENTNLKSEAVKAAEEVKALKSELTQAKKDNDKASEDLDKVVAEKAELESQVAKAEAEKVTADRISTLVEGGVDKVKAEEAVTKCVSLDTEQFAVVSDALVEAAFVKKDEKDEDEDEDKDKKKKEDKKAEASIEEDPKEDKAVASLEDAKVEPVVGSGDVEDNEEKAVAGLQKAIASYLN
jgi:hypothetical protein